MRLEQPARLIGKAGATEMRQGKDGGGWGGVGGVGGGGEGFQTRCLTPNLFLQWQGHNTQMFTAKMALYSQVKATKPL